MCSNEIHCRHFARDGIRSWHCVWIWKSSDDPISISHYYLKRAIESTLCQFFERNNFGFSTAGRLRSNTLKLCDVELLVPFRKADGLIVSNYVSKTLKRLDFYYEGWYELKTTVEPEMMMTYLRITLKESGNQIQDEIYTNEHAVYADE